MMRAVRMGIIFAAFIAISIAANMLGDNDEEGEDNISEQEAILPSVEETSIGEPIIISGLYYNVTNVSISDSLPVAGLEEQPQREYMLITMFVENFNLEPTLELSKSDFILVDSDNHKFTAIKSLSLYFDEAWGTLQPGLSGYRGVVFQIPFNRDLGYELLVGDYKIIQLGMGNDLNIMD
ncbi:MAG: hypothetical protein CMO16_03785 [Thaumarchaeota archaeon]|nr:hypothetical protein [Nitrososphaerota archaeon]